ncbi:flagellar protein FlaG [Alicyclobacillus sp. SP_1]|uniref:flagellar protein FlaG n=1 Tax=Alicyclobacillus sp. SP_1 TaxID=2942475 RepID=UPI0035BE742E
MTSDARLKSEFDLSKKAERYWINIMDVTTGQVVYKIPPEHLRKMFESALDVHI